LNTQEPAASDSLEDEMLNALDAELASELLDPIIDEALSQLTFDDEGAMASVDSKLREIAFNYLADLPGDDDGALHKQTTKKMRENLKKLNGALERATAALDAFDPSVLAIVEEIMQSVASARPHHTFDDIRGTIAALKNGAAIFQKWYSPTASRPPNLALETAVRAFIELMETEDDQNVVVALNKNRPTGPSLDSATAKSLGILLQRVDPHVSTTAIVNMVRKIRRRAQSYDPGFELMDANPYAVLDASLLPSRKTDHDWEDFLDT
jgi:hypothetical protein